MCQPSVARFPGLLQEPTGGADQMIRAHDSVVNAAIAASE
jgi:hypothetical protein